MLENATDLTRPGEGMTTDKMPGHWVLARLGKRVLRPGGIQLTRRMLSALQIEDTDEVVEFAPGIGVTARLTLQAAPESYTAIERDKDAAKIVSSYLKGDRQRCLIGNASSTGLPDQSATVVYGEAMLTMQTEEIKRSIVHEAHRILRQNGRYGIHEMCIRSENLDDDSRRKVEKALTGVVHHGVRPLTVSEWRSLLESEGFQIHSEDLATMSLLEPGRLISDEGFAGALRFAWNLIWDSESRRRVLGMRSIFKHYRRELGAVALVAIKR